MSKQSCVHSATSGSRGWGKCPGEEQFDGVGPAARGRLAGLHGHRDHPARAERPREPAHPGQPAALGAGAAERTRGLRPDAAQVPRPAPQDQQGLLVPQHAGAPACAAPDTGARQQGGQLPGSPQRQGHVSGAQSERMLCAHDVV